MWTPYEDNKGVYMARIHDRDLKLSLCRQIRAKELTKTKACRDHSLSASMLDRWLEQFDALGENAFQGQPWRAVALDAAGRIEQLEEELRLSRLETALARHMLAKKKSENASELK
jgi:transposase-like protein